MIPVYPATLPTPAASAVTPAERRFLSHERYPTEARTFERYRRSFERVTWPWMNAAKAAAWNDWWTNDLGYGGSWFKSTWPSPRGQVETDRHFVETPTWRFRGGGFWQVSALIETRARGSLPVYRSPCLDGPVWSAVTLSDDLLLSDSHQPISYGDGKFIAVGRRGDPSLAAVEISTDGGVSWSVAATPPNFGTNVPLLMAKWGDTEGLWVGLQFSDADNYATSPDGSVWTLRSKPSSSWYALSRVGGRFIATVSSESTANYRSAADGLSFSLNGAFPSAAQWREFAEGGGVVVGCGFTNSPINAVSARSTDGGQTWSAGGDLPENVDYFRCVYGNSRFVAFSPGAGGNNVAVSTDGGVTWTAGTLPPSRSGGFSSIVFDGLQFFLTGLWADVLRSEDGLTWEICPNLLPSTQTWMIATDGLGTYVAIDADGSLTTSAARGVC